MDKATPEQAQAVIGAQSGLLGKAQAKIGALTMEILQLQMALEQAQTQANAPKPAEAAK